MYSQQVDDVVDCMQKLLHMQAGLLCANQPHSVPEKCFWYLIHQNWHNGSWQYAQSESAHHLQVSDNSGQLVTIPQLPTVRPWGSF